MRIRDQLEPETFTSPSVVDRFLERLPALTTSEWAAAAAAASEGYSQIAQDAFHSAEAGGRGALWIAAASRAALHAASAPGWAEAPHRALSAHAAAAVAAGALAARRCVPPRQLEQLYQPFEPFIPLAELTAQDPETRQTGVQALVRQLRQLPADWWRRLAIFEAGDEPEPWLIAALVDHAAVGAATAQARPSAATAAVAEVAAPMARAEAAARAKNASPAAATGARLGVLALAAAESEPVVTRHMLYRPFAELIPAESLGDLQSGPDRLDRFIDRLECLTSSQWQEVAASWSDPDFATPAACAIARVAGIAFLLRDMLSARDFVTLCGPFAEVVGLEG